MSNIRTARTTSPTPAHLERRRIRARLLLAGVTVSAVAERAQVDSGFVSRIMAGEKSATSPRGQRVVAAMCELTGMSWADLSAPISVRRLAA